MAPYTCHQCGARVPEDEQFCPNCGAFLDPVAQSRSQEPKNVVSINSDGNYEEFELGAPPGSGQPGSARSTSGASLVTCPSCDAENPSNNRHCQECGARLSQSHLPTAPRPTVQATAGVRAALAISGLLFAVIVIALLFNVFSGGSSTTATTLATGTTTPPTVGELGPIDVISVECNPEGIGSFTCDSLVSGTADEYQINWEEVEGLGDTVTIRLTFRQPMTVQEIQWTNLEDPNRLKQNYRARGLLIDAKNALQPFPKELEDLPGLQSFPFAAVDANWIEFEIQTAYTAQVIDGNVFRELAIDEITIIGRTATTTG